MDLELILFTIPLAIPFFFLYTEIHYRFPFIFSRYFLKEPEILADIPYRINPNLKIPIMILIKDADKYPITLNNIKILLYQNSKIISTNTNSLDEKINQYWWHKTIFTNSDNTNGHVSIQVEINYTINNQSKTILNHNIKLLKPIPFQVFIAEHKLPGHDLAQYGDIHYHSNLTDDMVEFGAPVKPTLDACKVLGLDFICNTDHSYDLDDKPGSWTETDPELTKWNESRSEIKSLNIEFEFSPFMIPSEELSMHNSLGRNVHALILNNSQFLPGQGDGAEKPFDFSCEHNSNNLYAELEKNTLCIASHPFAPVPLLEWLFFKRGVWEDYDILQERMSGLQILNGDLDESFFRGVKEWVYYLLQGHKKFIYAGNDAHGNFNKFRQIDLPMVSIKESDKQILGVCRTGVFPEKLNDINSSIDAMRIGNCFITNGPFLNMTITQKTNIFPMGSDIYSTIGQLNILAISNSEFGKLKGYRILKGIVGNRKEIILKEITLDEKDYEMNIQLNIEVESTSYFRAEVETFNYRGPCIAMTNPIWLFPNSDEDL